MIFFSIQTVLHFDVKFLFTAMVTPPEGRPFSPFCCKTVIAGETGYVKLSCCECFCKQNEVKF